MSEIESSIKPDEIAEIKHDLEDRTYQSYIDQGFADNIPHQVEAPHTRMMRFLAEKGERPMQRELKMLQRIRHKNKEYLLAYIKLTSTNFFGDEVILDDYVEGFWKEQTKRPKRDEQRRLVSYIMGQSVDHYTIDFNKKNVDKYIGKQEHSSIRFFIKHEGGPQNDYFTYEQFLHNKWEDNMELLLVDGSPQYNRFNKPEATPTTSSP
jgi:hypothetical protein